LALLATDMENQAKLQADQATRIALTMEHLTHDLQRAVRELRGTSGQMGDALATISRIVEHTCIISINAGIEAARAGEHGLAFGVVVDEIKRLSDRIDQTAGMIKGRVHEMQKSIVEVATVAGNEENKMNSQTGTVEAINRQVHGMADTAGEQQKGAESLRHFGDQIKDYTERLLLRLGTLRFETHTLAEQKVALMLPHLRELIGERERCEAVLARWLEENDSFELAYVTDATGRQFVDNVGLQDGIVVRDKKGYGKDWSGRPWYLDAINHEEIRSTDIYRSAATGDFCFTVAAALRDDQGTTLGVVAADVNFRRLLQL
jgi:methyl-accepting chemotaxis protein